jgi:hypothetical protein
MIKTCDTLPLCGSTGHGGVSRRLEDQLRLLKGISLAKIPQKRKESDLPWEGVFPDTTKHAHVGLEQCKQALGTILVPVTARLCLLRVIDVGMAIALHRPGAARRVGIETPACAPRNVGRLVHRQAGAIAGRLHDDRSLAADPRDHGWPVLGIMATPGLACLPTATWLTAQCLLPAPSCLPLGAGSVIEGIGFHRPLHLPGHLLRQGGLA